MEVVDQRNSATLLPIISNHIEPGTTIWSDGWAAYNGMAALPGVAGHETVNHSRHFVNPRNGVNTNGIDSYWNRYALIIMFVDVLLHLFNVQSEDCIKGNEGSQERKPSFLFR